MTQFEKLNSPSKGSAIRFDNGNPVVPNDPIIPFIRGDGTGVDIWPATQAVLDSAIKKASLPLLTDPINFSLLIPLIF